MKALTERVAGRFRVIGISLSEDGLSDFVASHGMEFPVYSGLSRSAIDAYQLGTTPETIVVSPNGVVLGSWDGAYTTATKPALERFFAISFPPQSLVSDQASF
ncbi:MAG: peroxiredoxin family protein [Bryobacteraceae bacterium]